MEFRLYYEGLLKSNAQAKQKHDLRKHFHSQLKMLFNYQPLKTHADWYFGKDNAEQNPIRKIGNNVFTTIVNSELSLYAELDILMLKHDIFTGFGDMDNKLKTLLDGLRAPKEAQEIPKDYLSGNEPLVCLLADDNLVSKIDIRVDRMLKPVPNNTVFVLIKVNIKGVEAKYGNLSIIT